MTPDDRLLPNVPEDERWALMERMARHVHRNNRTSSKLPGYYSDLDMRHVRNVLEILKKAGYEIKKKEKLS